MADTGSAGTSTMRSMRSRSGPGQPAAILRNLRRRAAAGAMLVAEEPARTRVHRRDQHEPRGEDGGPRRAGDRDAPFLERLTQHLEHAAIELRHLVEEEHAVVRERDLAGPRDRAAADERDVRDGVMRRAKRPLAEQAHAGRQRAGDRMDRRALQRFVERQRRQDRSQPPRQHRLAGAGRARQQQVVAAGRRDFERAAREQLPAHVGKIAFACVRRCRGGAADRRRALRLVRPVQRIDRFRQRARDADVETLDDARLGGVLWRQQQPLQSETTGGDGDRQDAANAVDRRRRARARRR